MKPGKPGELLKYLALWRLGSESTRFCVSTALQISTDSATPRWFLLIHG